MTYEEQQAALRATVPLGTPGATELASQGYKDVGTNVPASHVGPSDPLKLPDSSTGTDYASIMAGLNASLPPEASTTETDKTRSDIAATTTELGGQSNYQAGLEQSSGLDATKKSLNDLQAQLLAVNNEAIASTLNVDRVGKPTFLTSAANLEKSNIEKDRTIKALGLSASIQALQGNISLAEDQVKRAVDLKYDPIKAKLETLNKQLDYNYKDFTAAEKKRADTLKAKNDLQLKQLEITRANEKDKNATLLNQMQSYPDAGITFNDTVESANAKITSKSKIYQDKIRAPQTTEGKPLDILDIGRYNELYPDAGITPGDTKAQADAKVQKTNAPKTFTDEELRNVATESKTKEKKTYDQVIAEIDSNPLIANKDRAKEIVAETFGKNKKPATPPNRGSFAPNPDQWKMQSINSISNFLFK